MVANAVPGLSGSGFAPIGSMAVSAGLDGIPFGGIPCEGLGVATASKAVFMVVKVESMTTKAEFMTQEAGDMTENAVAMIQEAVDMTEEAVDMTEKAVAMTQEAAAVTQEATIMTQEARVIAEEALATSPMAEEATIVPAGTESATKEVQAGAPASLSLTEGLADLLHDPSWRDALREEFTKPYFKTLDSCLMEEMSSHTVLPPKEMIFRAFDACPFDMVGFACMDMRYVHG